MKTIKTALTNRQRSHPDKQQQIEEDLGWWHEKVYPYENMDFFERFQEPQLPPKDVFYSSLTVQDIFEIYYIHTKRVINHFEMTNHGDYHNFYLLTNVLLLAEVF